MAQDTCIIILGGSSYIASAAEGRARLFGRNWGQYWRRLSTYARTLLHHSRSDSSKSNQRFQASVHSGISQTIYFIHDRVFENEGILVGDYRKNQGQMLNPQEDLSLWALPAPAARLLCRLVIYGKPLEVRLASEWFSKEASIVHRTLIGAFEGKPLKSTKLGMLTNAVLSAHGCPSVQFMRHAREHFSMELMLDVSASSNRKETRALEVPIHDTYRYETIHKIVTHSTGTYARGSCIVQQSLIQDG